MFWRHFGWSLEALLLPPVLLCLFISVLISLFGFYSAEKSARLLWKPYYWVTFAPLLLFPLVVAVGVAGYLDAYLPQTLAQQTQTNIWAQHTETALFWAALLISGFFVYKMKGLRILAFGIALFQQAVLMGGFFVAGMSISGDWL